MFDLEPGSSENSLTFRPSWTRTTNACPPEGQRRAELSRTCDTMKLRQEDTVLAQKGPSLGNGDCRVVQCTYLYMILRISAKIDYLRWTKLESFILWICHCNCLICNCPTDIFTQYKSHATNLSQGVTVGTLVNEKGQRGWGDLRKEALSSIFCL